MKESDETDTELGLVYPYLHQVNYLRRGEQLGFTEFWPIFEQKPRIGNFGPRSLR